MNLSAAIAQLQINADVCETNAPINEAAGETAQAQLERDNAQSYREAIAVLEAQ